jgi:hypothetical protein
MKTILTVIIMLMTVTLIVACTTQSPADTEVVVLRDITDKHLAQPDTNEILSLYELESKWNGGVFRISDLSNVSFNQAIETKLEARNEWLSNELDRDKEIKKFKNKVSEIIINNEKDSIGKESSSIYLPIARELNKLSAGKMQKRVLLIYSDLMENTSGMSFYDKQKLSLLKTNPDSITKYFDSQLKLKNLDEITIYMVYKPADEQADEEYKIVSGFYKNLFESKGAKVEITASIN